MKNLRCLLVLIFAFGWVTATEWDPLSITVTVHIYPAEQQVDGTYVPQKKALSFKKKLFADVRYDSKGALRAQFDDSGKWFRIKKGLQQDGAFVLDSAGNGPLRFLIQGNGSGKIALLRYDKDNKGKFHELQLLDEQYLSEEKDGVDVISKMRPLSFKEAWELGALRHVSLADNLNVFWAKRDERLFEITLPGGRKALALRLSDFSDGTTDLIYSEYVAGSQPIFRKLKVTDGGIVKKDEDVGYPSLCQALDKLSKYGFSYSRNFDSLKIRDFDAVIKMRQATRERHLLAVQNAPLVRSQDSRVGKLVESQEGQRYLMTSQDLYPLTKSYAVINDNPSMQQIAIEDFQGNLQSADEVAPHLKLPFFIGGGISLLSLLPLFKARRYYQTYDKLREQLLWEMTNSTPQESRDMLRKKMRSAAWSAGKSVSLSLAGFLSALFVMSKGWRAGVVNSGGAM